MTSEASGESGPFANTEATVALLFFFFALASGIFARQLLLIHDLFPYTALQFLLGFIFGIWNFSGDDDQLGTLGNSIDIWAVIDGELILFAFLPNLVFTDALNVNVHVFRRAFPQTLLLAGPGVALGAFLTALVAKFVLPYGWSWNISMVFGSILAATDPVAVVALLKDLGASPILSTIIAGEALLNDGTAVVFFELFAEAAEGENFNTGKVIAFFARNVLGAPAIGAAFAFAIVVWFQYTSDAIVQVALTVAGANLVFFVSQFEADASGVLAVVTFGVVISAIGKPSATGEAGKFLEVVWEHIEWIANTVIFFLAGAITADVTVSRATKSNDFGYLLILYLFVYVIRFFMLGLFYPILKRVGYGTSVPELVVMGHGGLRGAVGLALALSFAESSEISDKTTRERILFFVAGIAFLTLIVNGPTTAVLSRLVGLTQETAAQRDVVREAREFVSHKLLAKYAKSLRKDNLLGKASDKIVFNALRLHSAYTDQKQLKNIRSHQSAKDLRHLHRRALSTRGQAFEDKIRNLYGQGNHDIFHETISRTMGAPMAEKIRETLQNPDASSADLDSIEDHPLVRQFVSEFRKDLRTRFFTQLKREYWEMLEEGHVIGSTATLLLESVEVASDLPHNSKFLGDWEYLQYYCQIPKDKQFNHKLKRFEDLLRRLNWLLGWVLGWRHGIDLGLAVALCWAYIQSHNNVRRRIKQFFDDYEKRHKDIQEQIGSKSTGDEDYIQQLSLLDDEAVHREFQLALAKNDVEEWHLLIIRREVEEIDRQSMASEKYAQDIIEYVNSTWPRIISCVKSYQTIRVLLNHKAHLIEQLRKDGLLSDQEMTTLIREVYKSRLRELRNEYHARYTLSASTLQTSPSDGNLMGNISRGPSAMVIDSSTSQLATVADAKCPLILEMANNSPDQAPEAEEAAREDENPMAAPGAHQPEGGTEGDPDILAPEANEEEEEEEEEEEDEAMENIPVWIKNAHPLENQSSLQRRFNEIRQSVNDVSELQSSGSFDGDNESLAGKDPPAA